MLVVSRKTNERIVLTTQGGMAITVVVVRIGQGVCRIGIDAPASVAIHRDNIKTLREDPK